MLLLSEVGLLIYLCFLVVPTTRSFNTPTRWQPLSRVPVTIHHGRGRVPLKPSKTCVYNGKEGKGIPVVWSLSDTYEREVSFNAKFSSKPFKSFSRKRLGEPIGNSICSWNVFQFHCPKALDLSLPLALDFHVLCAGMVLRVRGQGDGSLVVTTNDSRGFSLA